MGQYTLKVYPNAINATRVQKLVEDFNALIAGFQADAAIKGQTLNGFSQAVAGCPSVKFIELDSSKPGINTLVHEIGHEKWPGLGNDATGHDPRFYRLLHDAMKEFGLTPTKYRDLQGLDPHTIKDVPSLVPNGGSPLDFNKPRSTSDSGDASSD